jgi:hypothetical protein
MSNSYSKERQELKRKLERVAKEILSSLSPELRKTLLKDLAKLILIKLRNEEISNGRRVTRSMSARASSITSTNNVIDKSMLIPSTPKISPFLPETPAAAKKIKETQSKENKTKFETRKQVASNEPRILGSTITSTLAIPEPILTVQLDNGKVLNVNLASDPNNLRMSLGVEALKEVKQRMESYASQVANFFKRLKNI